MLLTNRLEEYRARIINGEKDIDEIYQALMIFYNFQIQTSLSSQITRCDIYSRYLVCYVATKMRHFFSTLWCTGVEKTKK